MKMKSVGAAVSLGMLAAMATAGSIVEVQVHAGVHAQEMQSGVSDYASDSGAEFAEALAIADGTGTVQVLSRLAVTGNDGSTLTLSFDCQRTASIGARPSAVFYPAGTTNAFLITVSSTRDFTLTATWDATCTGYVFGMPYSDLYDGNTFLVRLFESWADKPHPAGSWTNQLTGQPGARTFRITLAGNSFASVPVTSQQNDRVTGTITLHFAFPPKFNQTITFPAIPNQVVTSRLALAATASSGLPVSFTVQSGPGLITGLTNLTFTGAGTVSVVASQAGDNEWNPAPNKTNTFNVAKSSQTITFPAIPNQVVTSRVTLAATTSSGLPVSFTVQSGPGRITGGTLLEFTGTGVVHVAAGQSGDNEWNPAPTVTRTVTVNPAPPPITGIQNADFDGDGLADPAIYDERAGTWTIKMSGSGYAPMTYAGILGGPGWMPAAGDYDGDGLTDPAVYQVSSGNWTIMQSGSGYTPATFTGLLGGPGWMPAPSDYDGDGRADPAVYQELSGNWQLRLSAAGYSLRTMSAFLGAPGWSAATADYDGDGRADPAVYNCSGGTWEILTSGSGYTPVNLPGFLGGSGWQAVPADYDGDGLADPAVRKADGSEWRFKLSRSGYTLTTMPLGL